jgi:hypothetical protein
MMIAVAALHAISSLKPGNLEMPPSDDDLAELDFLVVGPAHTPPFETSSDAYEKQTLPHPFPPILESCAPSPFSSSPGFGAGRFRDPMQGTRARRLLSPPATHRHMNAVVFEFCFERTKRVVDARNFSNC